MFTSKIRSAIASVALIVIATGCDGCQPRNKYDPPTDPKLSAEERLDVGVGNLRAAEKDALDILARSTNWRNLQLVSVDAFRGEFHAYTLAGIEPRLRPGLLVNGQPVFDQIKHFNLEWQTTTVRWGDLFATQRGSRGRTRSLLERDDGIRPVFGQLVYEASVDPAGDQASGFIAAWEDGGDADAFQSMLQTIRDVNGKLSALRQQVAPTP